MIFAENPIKKYPLIVKLCEFEPPERALFTQCRKEAYEALHPETKHEETRNGGLARQVGDPENRAPRFNADTAARTGQSERSVQRDAASQKYSRNRASSTRPRRLVPPMSSTAIASDRPSGFNLCGWA